MNSTFDDTFDYLALLGIDPARLEVQSREETREQINRRKKEWTAQAINPLYQQQARSNLERARQFEQIVDSPEALQAYLAFHAAAQIERRKLHEPAIAELVALAAGTGKRQITREQYALLARACEERGVPLDVLDGIVRSRRLTIREDEPVAGACGIPYKEPALDRTLMAQIAGHLRLLGKESLYELVDQPATASPAKIISTAQILFDRWSKTLPKTSECVAWEKSLQACLTYLKDVPSKSRYDHAVYNRRLDDFLARVDLLLASGRFTREDFGRLATIGVEEFGLAGEIVNQCVRWRAGTKGLSLSKPVQVNVSTAGLVKCQRCFRLVAQGDHRCRYCGCAFDRHCHNPSCGRPLASGARTCEHCGLPAARGVQYAELLRLARALVNIGDASGALEACRLADQILPAPQVEELASRAAKVRALSTSVRRATADRRWTQVERDLSELLNLAPQFSQPGCPRLEEVSRFLSQLQNALAQIPAGSAPATEARICLDVLEKWSDCVDLPPRLHRLLEALEESNLLGPAVEIADRLAALEPVNEVWQGALVRLRHKQDEGREKIESIARFQEQLRLALESRRLYAAQRALTELRALGAAPPEADPERSLQERLSQVEGELEGIRRAAAEGASPDELIARHVELLERCRDCRESLTALQSLTPAPPGPPTSVAVAVQGTRRLVTWEADSPAQDVVWIVQRSIQRAGGRGGEGAWTSVFEGAVCWFVDDAVLHAGTIVRYSVQALRRGKVTIAGDLLREYAVPSPPALAEPVLLWQEVLGLRVRPTEDGWEVSWHAPAGVRQVLAERWVGTRDDRPDRPDVVPVSPGNRLRVERSADGQPISLRMYAVYDGPRGDFLTPGTIATLLAGADAKIESAAADGAQALPADYVDDLHQTAHADPGSERVGANNPLKRMGIWPPVPRTG